MINLTVDEIQLLHKKLIKATGGLSGIRDLGLLESAVYGAMQSFGDEEAYPEPEQRASRLAFAITQNHPFLDGNKRTGMMAMLMTLMAQRVIMKYWNGFIVIRRTQIHMKLELSWRAWKT